MHTKRTAGRLRFQYNSNMAETQPVNEHHRRLREIGLGLPEAFETRQLGDHRVFKVGKKTFLWMDESFQAVTIKADEAAREILLQDPRFEVARYIGRYGWMSWEFGPDPDWDEVEEMVVDSYRMCAQKRQLKQLDALPS